MKRIRLPKFTVNDVAEQLVQILPTFNLANNKANLSTYLRLATENGLIELVTPGRGRLPAVYRLKK